MKNQLKSKSKSESKLYSKSKTKIHSKSESNKEEVKQIRKSEPKTQQKIAFELIEIGTLGSAVGISGEARLNLYSGSDRNIFTGQKIILSDKIDREDMIELEINSVRIQKGFPIVSFKEISDRTEVSKLTGKGIFLQKSDMKKLKEDEFYVMDLIGMTAYDIRSEKEIGKIKDVLTNTAQPIYVIESNKKKDILVPGVPQFIKDIDLEKRVIEFELIAGFIEDEI